MSPKYFHLFPKLLTVLLLFSPVSTTTLLLHITSSCLIVLLQFLHFLSSNKPFHLACSLSFPFLLSTWTSNCFFMLLLFLICFCSFSSPSFNLFPLLHLLPLHIHLELPFIIATLPPPLPCTLTILPLLCSFFSTSPLRHPSHTSSCLLMLLLSTRQCRTLRTECTFQIFGESFSSSISGSLFLPSLERNCENDWNW